MESKSNILKILNIEKSEVHSVLWTFLYSFFLGAAIAYFFTGSTSLFLNSFEREMIPLSFIIAGIIVIVVGQIYSQLQKKLQFSYNIIGALAFLLISVILFFVFFSVFKSIVIIFALYAWNRVIAYIHNVVFWGMAGKLFSLKQSKRVLGLVTGGEVIGLIVAFFSIPVLLKILKTEDLLLIAGICLLVGFIILLIITRKFSVELASVVVKKNQSTLKAKTKKISFLQNRYYSLFFIIAFVPIFAQFFVDYIFQAQVKVEYPSKEQLTAFVGIFFGFSAIVEFILKTFISGRLMSRYGMKLGLLAFPIVMAISMLLASLFGFIYGAVSLFFSFIALGRLFTRAVRASFNDPATQLLYQPIPPDERASFQNKVESGPKAYASIVAGILLFIFAKIPGVGLVYFSLFLLLVTILWFYSAREIYTEYRNMLQNILSGKKDKNDIKLSHPLIQKIQSKIESGKIKEARSVARLSKMILPFDTEGLYETYPELRELTIDGNELKFSTLIDLSKSENPQDRILSLKHLHKYSIYKVEKPLTRLLHDEDFEVKCEAIIATAKIKETDLYPNLLTLFQNPEFKIVTARAMIYIGTAILPEIDHNFQKTEYDIGLQLDTIELLEQVGGDRIIEFLKKNINHHNKSISDKVIQALGNLKYTAGSKESQIIWQKLVNEIKNYVFITSALVNLTKQIDSPYLLKALEFEKKNKKSKIFAGLSILYDPFAIMLIAESLDSTDKNSRGFAIEVADMIISDLHKPLLLPLIESDSDIELLERYMLYFPSGKPGLIEQLTDIVNSEYWVTGLFAKAIALKILAQYTDKHVMPILMANIVHPRPIMWQLAAWCIYNTNKKTFENEIYQNFPKVPGLKDFAADIEAYKNGTKFLIYDRVMWLKTSKLFENIPEDELIEIATTMQKKELEPGQNVTFNRKTRQLYSIVDGSLNDTIGTNILRNGDIFCPWLQVEGEQSIMIAAEQKTAYISMDIHLINNLITRYKDFSIKLMEALWKESETSIIDEKRAVENSSKTPIV